MGRPSVHAHGPRRRATRAAACIVALTVAPALATTGTPARAQDAATVLRAWSVSRAPLDVATADGRVFVLDRRGRAGLAVVDALAAAVSPPLHVAVPGVPKGLAYARTITLDPETFLHRVDERVFVATGANDAEIVAIAVPPGASPVVEQVIDLPGTADAACIAAHDGMLYVGRRRSDAPELVISRLDGLRIDGTPLGTLDLPEAITAIDVASGIIRASSRRATYVVDASDPGHPALVATVARDPVPQPPLAVARAKAFVIDGPLGYVATKQRDADLQQIDLHLPFGFPDADHDGVWRVGCLGDSNTEAGTTVTRWCERLAALVDDPGFAVVNLGREGATAIPSDIDATTQVQEALDPSRHLDAAILAYGTNDTNLVHFAADPALFDAQIVTIADALEQHAATLVAAGITTYVATTPPRWKALFGPDGHNERIVALNDELRQRFAAERIVEFYDGFHPDPSELLDGVHLSQRGQDKRAWRALVALTR